MDAQTRALWLCVRQALLMLVDGIERFLDITPRTAEARQSARAKRRDDPLKDNPKGVENDGAV